MKNFFSNVRGEQIKGSATGWPIQPVRATKLLLGLLLTTTLGIAPTWAQKAVKLHPQEPINNRYATLATSSDRPSRGVAETTAGSLSTKEYSPSAAGDVQLRPTYLTPKDSKAIMKAVKPPANSSERTRMELEHLVAIQIHRTPEQITRSQHIAQVMYSPTLLNPSQAGYEKNMRDLFYIGEPVGPQFTAENFPMIKKLLHNAMVDTRVTELQLKQHFSRPRPYDIDPSLQPLSKLSSPSFPCSNTLNAFVQAYVLSEVIPSMRQKFLDRANEVRWSRELLGVQFPSDDEAARVVAGKLLQRWARNPQFHQDLLAAQAEWSAQQKVAYQKPVK